MLRTAAELWLAGAPIDWTRRYEGERRIKRVLPTYPFERRRYWIVEQRQQLAAQPGRRQVAALRPGARSRGGTSAGEAARSRYLMETVTWRRVQYSGCRQVRFQARRAAVAGVQSHRKASTSGSIAALRERGGKVTVIEKGGEIQNIRRGRHRRLIRAARPISTRRARRCRSAGETTALQVGLFLRAAA